MRLGSKSSSSHADDKGCERSAKVSSRTFGLGRTILDVQSGNSVVSGSGVGEEGSGVNERGIRD